VKQTATKSSLRIMARSVPVFLIDDNRLLRDGLSAMLSARGLSVVATARSGEEVAIYAHDQG
jgi:YesN/AraC family two-component response regulator